MTADQVSARGMATRLAVAPEFNVRKKDSLEAAKFSMRLLVRAANQDRGLMDDKDWQQAMTHLNEVIRKGENI